MHEILTHGTGDAGERRAFTGEGNVSELNLVESIVWRMGLDQTITSACKNGERQVLGTLPADSVVIAGENHTDRSQLVDDLLTKRPENGARLGKAHSEYEAPVEKTLDNIHVIARGEGP